MNKGLGATGIGAAVLAGAMVYAGKPAVNSTGGTPTSRPAIVQAEKPASGEGPWLASCKYWAASRLNNLPDQQGSPELHITLNETDKKFDTEIKGTPDNSKTECERQGDGWGIPSSPSPQPDIHQTDIRAIIATVPDPIHSHFALEFDRTVDAFMQAAADNRYLGSSYWLPWRSPSASSTETATIATQTEEDRKREQQPGLIILKYNPRDDEKKDLGWSGYHRVVYLFLVGESPSFGVDGNQLRNALQYEAILQDKHNVKLSMGDDNLLAIIGPRWSGSAASLREGIENAKFVRGIDGVLAAGMTSTQIAADELNARSPATPIDYLSFGENAAFEADQLTTTFRRTVPHSSDLRVAILTEDNTVFGEATTPEPGQHRWKPTYIRFPREISLLRNAQSTSSSSSEPPTPYLSLSLKDTSTDDTVPRFSTSQTPLSQEAQLMAIAHQLQRDHTEFIFITASNILDELFLAQFLHRACPDARLVFYNGQDRLVERDVDNVQYIGSISVTPFILSSLASSGSASRAFRAFPDSQSEGIYNAASYIFWKGTPDVHLILPNLAGYLHGSGDSLLQAPLWATAVGGDGYYPLGILSPCASNSGQMLPNIYTKKAAESADSQFIPQFLPAGLDAPPIPKPPPWTARCTSVTPALTPESANASPSLLWSILCVFIICLCALHAGLLWSAQYWSPLTRDLAICENDQPRRRTVYINIGTAILFCIAFVVAFPMVALTFPRHCPYINYFHSDRSIALAFATLIFGLGAVIITIVRARHYLRRSPTSSNQSPTRLYPFFNLLALVTVISLPAAWAWICLRDDAHGFNSCVGLFFSYRSIHPGSGVSPIVPVLFLLLGWYLWAILQTARLRFSTLSRPRLPGSLDSTCNSPLFVSDCSLTQCKTATDSCLFENITCLLITREILRRLTALPSILVNLILLVIYLGLFAIGIRYGHMQSLERFLLQPGGWPTPFESLIAALFYPLIMIALTGWLRMIFIWSALSRGLLEPLERLPLRFAFNRIKEVGWMTMLSQSSLHIRWRDMARSGESVRQLINNPELRRAIDDWDKWKPLKDAADSLYEQIRALRYHIGLDSNPPPVPLQEEYPVGDDDMPDQPHRRDLCYIYAIEIRYARFCELLLEHALIPYWRGQRIGFVDDHGDSPEPESKIKCDPDAPQDPLYIRLAEELLAVRYIALIRSVLVNIRYLMMFVSSAFVLAIVAWNSYPFQPHRLIDWCFTILLIFLGIGLVAVFAQMHRSAILSRITDTSPNKLGWDFYIRIITFGAVPVLTWFAYQFPEIGGSVFKILQPGLQVIK
jgi:hypothetical protein